MWEQVGTGHVPSPELPPPRPSPPVNLTKGKKREDTENPLSLPPLPPLSPQGQGPSMSASKFAETCSNQRGTDSLVAYPAIFDLLRDDGTTQPAERVNILESLPLQERPAILIIVEGPTRHLRVSWGIGKPTFYYANKTTIDNHIVAFSRDIVAGDTPPSIAINPNWWDLEDLPIPSPHRAASEVNKLRPDKNSISKAAAVADQYRIPLAYITPIALVHPLLTAPYLSPVAAYTLLLERSTAWS